MLQHAFIYGSCLKEFDAFPLLETSVNNGAKESDVHVFWLNKVFAGVFLDDISCVDTNVT